MGAVEQVTGAVTRHGEGPVWSPAWGGLRFVDMLDGGVLTLGENGAVRRMDVGRVAAFVRPRRTSGYVVATEHGIALADDVDDLPTTHVPLTRAPGERMNEGTAAPDGSLYAGSSSWEVAPGVASLYRVTPDLQVERVLGEVTISNGIDYSPDHSRAYYVDGATGRIDVFDVDAGRLASRRPFAELSREVGDFDGLAVDAHGGVWVAVYGAGQVRRYSPAGELDAIVEVPVAHVTACTFGGEDLRTLFITTSRLVDGDAAVAGAGAVFAAAVDVPGLPVRPFGG